MKIFMSISIILLATLSFNEIIRANEYIPTGCELPPTLYAPYLQTHNPQLNNWRKDLNQKDYKTKKIFEANPNISIIEKCEKDETYYCRCFQYAIKEITQYKGPIELPRPDRISIDLSNYFIQIPRPQKNSLLIWTTSATDKTVHHFGVAMNEIWCTSKSGARREITQHLPFDIIDSYGRAMWAFTLKEKYFNNQALLLQDIEAEIEEKQKKAIDDHKKRMAELFPMAGSAIQSKKPSSLSQIFDYFLP